MKSLRRSAVWMAVLLVISKLMGVVREICVAQQFGTSYIVDAYTVSASLPAVLFTLFAKGFSESYLPTHVRTAMHKREQLFNNTLTILTAASFALVALALLLSRPIAQLLAPGFDLRASELTVFFIRIVVFQLPFFTAFALFSARVSAEEDFTVPNFCNFIVVNLVLIASVYCASEDAPAPLAFGFVLSAVLALAILALYARRRYAIRFRPVFAPRDGDFRQLVSLAIPLGVSLLVNQLNTVIDRMFSSALGEGITSALGYADKIQSTLLTLTTSIFLSVCYPRMNRYFAENDREGAMSYARRAVMIACYTSIPLTVLFAVYAESLIRFVFERGSFTAQSTQYTAVCLRFYSFGILFFAIRTVLNNVLAANTKQSLILKNTAITVACNVALNAVLVRVMGYAGLALATSLAGLLACVLMYRDIRKMGLRFFVRSQRRDLWIILLCTAFALGISLLLFRPLNARFGSNIAIFFTSAFSALGYVALSIPLQPDILLWLYAHLPKRLQILPFYNRKIGENTHE